MKLETIKKVIQYLVDIDSPVALTEHNWLDFIEEFEDKYGENASLTKEHIETHFRDN